MTSPTPESELHFRRIEITVSDHVLPEIVSALGGIAAKHDLDMQVRLSDSDVAGIVIESTEPMFNPLLIDWMVTDESTDPVPVIPKTKLAAAETRDFRGLAERSFNAISSATSRAPVSRGLCEFVFRQEGKVQGFKADRFTDMVGYLSQPFAFPKSFGSKSLAFFYHVQENLYLPSAGAGIDTTIVK